MKCNGSLERVVIILAPRCRANRCRAAAAPLTQCTRSPALPLPHAAATAPGATPRESAPLPPLIRSGEFRAEDGPVCGVLTKRCRRFGESSAWSSIVADAEPDALLLASSPTVAAAAAAAAAAECLRIGFVAAPPSACAAPGRASPPPPTAATRRTFSLHSCCRLSYSAVATGWPGSSWSARSSSTIAALVRPSAMFACSRERDAHAGEGGGEERVHVSTPVCSQRTQRATRHSTRCSTRADAPVLAAHGRRRCREKHRRRPPRPATLHARDRC